MINGFNDDDFSDSPNNESKENSEFARMFEESIKQDKARRYSVGDKVNAEIVVVGKDEIFVALGGSKDGIVRKRELQDTEGKVPYKVGDRLDLYVTQTKGGEIYLSPNKTSKNLAEDLEDAFDKMIPIEGLLMSS